jgi:CTP:molybdopterin cytidylyltransferase MocA
LLRALVERHAAGLYPVVAPFVDADRRANPVLFDSATANALLALTGDQGGRRILSSFPVERLDWHDESMLFDVDSPEDYRRLLDSTGG